MIWVWIIPILSGAFLFCLLIALAVYLMRRGDSDGEEWLVSDDTLDGLRRERERASTTRGH